MRKIYFILILLPVFYSCKKSTSNDVLPDPRLYVYISGAETNGSVNVAKYWENGQATILTDGTKTHGHPLLPLRVATYMLQGKNPTVLII